MANPPKNSDSKNLEHIGTREVKGSVDGASRMKPVVGNKKPDNSNNKK
jgi:hypothetical protein